VLNRKIDLTWQPKPWVKKTVFLNSRFESFEKNLNLETWFLSGIIYFCGIKVNNNAFFV